jgi:hypothetical protein
VVHFETLEGEKIGAQVLSPLLVEDVVGPEEVVEDIVLMHELDLSEVNKSLRTR